MPEEHGKLLVLKLRQSSWPGGPRFGLEVLVQLRLVCLRMVAFCCTLGGSAPWDLATYRNKDSVSSTASLCLRDMGNILYPMRNCIDVVTSGQFVR